MGRNLREHLLLSVHDDERNARPCLCFTREIARQLLLAVDYIHSEGVAHRGWFYSSVSLLKGLHV